MSAAKSGERVADAVAGEASWADPAVEVFVGLVGGAVPAAAIAAVLAVQETCLVPVVK